MAQEQIDVNKQNYKLALSVFLRTILSAVLSFFVFMSISMIFSGLGTSEIGYQIVEKHEDGSYTIIEEHMYTEEELQQHLCWEQRLYRWELHLLSQKRHRCTRITRIRF